MSFADNGDDCVEWLGTSYSRMLSAEDTGGAMSIVDSVGPPGSGPPRHVHRGADETFVMLSGEAEFWMAGETVVKQVGESVFVPRGTEHTFRVTGDKPSRHLVILTPGGFDGFFYEMAARSLRIPEDMEAVTEAAQRYQLEFTGPPLGAMQQEKGRDVS
ncbi:cupin domain-containing protein [Aquicoccus porphyridii]|uniref:Cupin domain-containing protein n=1 Tax=Aquicoccus porphyridii TaxID=1852029 RepID=A0A5A9ZKY5_9RHOB|nr:cupin domain-containing protein [Aquicoccus porphyridii]KAA0917606.1 cupin domain-containing protein [Aquicoccus porphyridii]RAI55683.1 cupin domain-containing protein [Rhodobacteraceae bacterium AsT-22]